MSDDGSEPLADRIGRRIGDLSAAERRVAEYLWKHPGMIVLSTAGELGALSGTSDATVIRTVKALGYSGLPELKRAVGRDVVSDTPAARLRKRVEQAGDDTTSLLDELLAESVDRLTETRRLLSEPAFTAAVELLAGANTVLGYGLGVSELPVRYLATRLQRLGRRARSTSATGFRLADELLTIEAGDVVVLNAPERLLPDMTTLVRHARSSGAGVLLLTDSLGATLDSQVDVTLTATRSPSGLTQEGLSTTLVLDCLLLAIAKKDPSSVSANTELLASLRERLVPGAPRPRRP
ncbi:MurR/RpiR family transcriptional regulator [Amycolatopsis sp. WQ 127309]|uniref:MurR/RpiR family transcriptional regulator n=1 Tax=Amycolatopsis sp. WQ 127309 TaxID=2932773 RepID=UPI001FF1FE61|nr:MurR/RpiR family transcriptional regulator [Amycolatopsis sp. WQ 127309]UOZ02958.1 MurR/RpiR family transcriptional regulator [Amycolatopsis sp. WQ 127309]